MRIGVFIEPWISQRAGISVFTEHLVRSSSNSDHTYITIGSRRMDVPNEHIHISKWKASHFNFFKFIGIAKIDMAIHQLDYVIDPGHFACLDLFQNTSRIVIIHDLTPILFPQFHRIKSAIAHRLLLDRSLRKCDKIITVSENSKKDVIESKMHRLYPGVRDLDLEQSQTTEEEFQRPFILSIGTIEPRKNHKALIEAFDQFCQTNTNVNLFIVGDRGWKVDIKTLVESSPNRDRILYLGYVPKASLKKLYANALFSMYISLYEGFGFPVIEAMNMGCPVITSDLGSMKEIAEGAAILVDPMSINEISNAMLRLVKDSELRTQLINDGFKQGKKFVWSNYILELDGILARTL